MLARLAWLALLVLPLGGVAQERPGAARPVADAEAIAHAQSTAQGDPGYSSHRAYLHYLEARRAEAHGDVAAALVHLRQALVYDESSPDIRFHLARLQFKTHDRARALATLERLNADHPDYAPAHLLYGFVLRTEGRHAEAAVAFARAIEADPEFEEAYLARIGLLAEEGRYEEAEKLANRLAERRPGEGKAFRILAVLAKENGRADWENRFLRRAVELEPSHLPAVLELAVQEERAGRLEEAARLYGRVLVRDPSDPTALLGSARIALRQGDEGSARAFLRQLFGTHPDPVGVRLRTALDLDMAEKPERALEVLEEAKGIAPSDPRIFYFQGLVLERRGDFRAALDAYRRVPANAGSLYPLSRARWANCLSLLGEWEEALRILDLALATSERLLDEEAHVEVLRFVPDVYRRARRSYEAVSRLRKEARRLEGNPTVILALATALQDTGQHGEAIRLLERLVEADSSEAHLYALAVARERAGDPEGAVEVVSRILETNPEDPVALNFVGYVLADHGLRLEEARQMLLRAVELRPDEPAYLDSLGWCELQLGDLAAAEPYLLRAAQMRPEDPEILHHLAELHFRAGRFEEAVATWQKALQLLERDPDLRLAGIIEKRLLHARSRLR